MRAEQNVWLYSIIYSKTRMLFYSYSTGYLNHNYLKQKQEGHLKQQVSEEVDYSNALWRRDYDRSLEADPLYGSILLRREGAGVQSVKYSQSLLSFLWKNERLNC